MANTQQQVKTVLLILHGRQGKELYHSIQVWGFWHLISATEQENSETDRPKRSTDYRLQTSCNDLVLAVTSKCHC